MNKKGTIDIIPIDEALSLMISHHEKAVKSVKNQLGLIESIIDVVHLKLNSSKNSRLIYCGAGTSGRIGVQDGVELLPTFGWPKDRLCFLIAGGEKALLEAIENAEDDTNLALKNVDENNINEHDIVICLAASGNTEFTKSVIIESKKRKALTIGIINNPNGKINGIADFTLILNTGEEVVRGSTRLKAGTSQKIALNIISTMLMTLHGSVKEGEMINMIPTNKKLKKRKKRIEQKFL